jgi:hypothetical protein
MVQITYQLTADDYRHGAIAWRSLRAYRKWFVPGVSFLCGVALARSIQQAYERPTSLNLAVAGALIGVAVFWIVVVWLGPPFSARRQFSSMPTAHGPITIEASESGLHILSVHTESRVAWSAYVAWAEERSVFIILPQPRIYVPIPKRAFTAEQIVEFRETLRRGIPPQKK